MKIIANKLSIEIEDTGGQGTPILLIMGLGMQLIAWPPAMVQALVQAGYRVIRMDNRDIGLSQFFDHLGTPNILWAGIQHKLGLRLKAPYTLHHMALDAVGVLDTLQVSQAHIVGVSMGGMIAQRLALAAPERCISLTSIMSSSGARGLPEAKPHVLRALLLSRPAGPGQAPIVAHYVQLLKAIGSPNFPTDDTTLRTRIAEGIERSYHPQGTLRQMVAVAADCTRAAELSQLRSPTLVIHGKADPLVPHACGADTARRIPGARLASIDGMGHDLPPGVVDRLLERLLPFIQAQPIIRATA